MTQQPLNEFLELGPYGLKEYGRVADIVVYSGDKLVNEVTNMVSKKHPKLLGITKTGFEHNNLMVGYTKKPWSLFFKNLKNLISRDPNEVVYLGLYNFDTKQLNVFLDESVNILGKSDGTIVPKIIHELCHALAHQNKKVFFSTTMNKYLLPFYTHLLNNIIRVSLNNEEIEKANITIDPKELKKTLIKLSIYNENANNDNLKQILIQTSSIWINFFQNIGLDNEASTFSTNLLLYPYIVGIGLNPTPDARKHALNVVKYYMLAYKRVFNIQAWKYTFPGQEMRFPSEVISVLNEATPKNDVINAISTLKLDY